MSGFGKHPEKSSAAATKVETTGSVKLLPTAAGGTMVEEKKTKTESGGGPMVQVPLPFGFQVQVKRGASDDDGGFGETLGQDINAAINLGEEWAGPPGALVGAAVGTALGTIKGLFFKK